MSPCTARDALAPARVVERVVRPDELRAVRAFENLEVPDLEWLCRFSADISLAPGEFAVHDGDPPALVALLEGQIEAVKVVDGVDRVIGKRGPGDLFGEISITLGTPHPAGFRAVEAARVLRIEPQDYHALAANVPEVATCVGRLAADRIGGPRGLQALASSPTPYRAIVLGHRWDAACADLRRFLDRNQIRSDGCSRTFRSKRSSGEGRFRSRGTTRHFGS